MRLNAYALWDWVSNMTTDPYTEPDYVAIEEIHNTLHTEGITRRQMIEQIQNHLSAWAMSSYGEGWE